MNLSSKVRSDCMTDDKVKTGLEADGKGDDEDGEK